ncbi:hypothetical protein E1301_Tti018299 [Triplophysa tibetana]|uniref:Uncharacterized protein n=1 Tax=Triplophysa tibetana TaxID=1572043 RepID=A0A5A9NBQ0_9TELE|nr:hypothetical protein E1301_Tti018299 [Triplophysa tibetana]
MTRIYRKRRQCFLCKVWLSSGRALLSCITVRQKGTYKGVKKTMDRRPEKPMKAVGYLKELTEIIETQKALLQRQKTRIFELEQHVSDLWTENSRLRHEYQRHLLTCRMRPIQDTPQQQ